MSPRRPFALRPLLALLLLLLLQGARCLRIRTLVVPDSVALGSEGVRLSCLFDPEREELYSVKWYKDEVEFFRFLPRERPVYQSFDIGDVQVDMRRSSNGTVWLKGVERSAEGLYRCEVSADAPSFHSISSEKYMAVDVPPADASSLAQTGHWPAQGQYWWWATLSLLQVARTLCG